MKKYLLLITTLFSCLFLSAQDKVEKYLDRNFKECDPSVAEYYSTSQKKDSLWHERTYYMAEKTLQMEGYYFEGQRNGQFTFFYPNGKIKEQGLFLKNRREGIHLRFHMNGMMQDSTKFSNGKALGNSFSWFENGLPSAKMMLDTIGNETGYAIRYFENKKVSEEGAFAKNMKKNGSWNYYHSNGLKSAEVNYDYGVAISQKCFNEKREEQPQCSIAPIRAEFPGGQEKLNEYISNHLKWPRGMAFREQGVQKIFVAFVIDVDGSLIDIQVIKSFHPAFDNSALQVVVNMPKWNPAREFNRCIKEKFILPLSYRSK